MSEARSDALVLFGATGDLAFKKIFPALHAMAKRNGLDVPIVGLGRGLPGHPWHGHQPFHGRRLVGVVHSSERRRRQRGGGF